MVFDRTLIPLQLRTGPAVGFLCLTELLPLLGLRARRLADWDRIERILKDLDCELRETVNLSEIDHDILTELVIHRDRVTFVLDAWERGYYTEEALEWLVRQEQNLRLIQREKQLQNAVARDSIVGKRV